MHVGDSVRNAVSTIARPEYAQNPRSRCHGRKGAVDQVGVARVSNGVPLALVSAKIEQLVFNDGPAYRGAELF